MRIKICGIRNQDDVDVAVKADADAVGFLVGQLHASTDFILPSTASRLASELPPYITPVIVTHLKEADKIMEIILRTGISNVQLHGGSSLPEVKKLRDLMPLCSKIILSTYIVDNKCVPEIKQFYPFIDAVLLDAYNREPNLIGQENVSNSYNWEFSANVVKECPLPVILAGALDGSNVAEAVKLVKPYGVDANNRLKTEDGKGRSLEKCINFVRNARNATI
ncbi:MAG: hypothetical protein A2017_21645 [Lentisphaerae bacterium GWF2_44_16]|nr:MAG: hypothetical protein A2017_21645 [Lentisphaerae bacterium GWF2_44_16]